MFIKLLTVLSILYLSGAIAQNQGSSDKKRNPIVNLFEAPLKAFRTRPGEAIAVFKPEIINVEARQENGTDSTTSWFPAELGTIGSAAQSLLPGWLSGRTTTTTVKPEIIIQVHQNDRNRQHPILNIGPVHNSNEESNEENSDEDDGNENDSNENDGNEDDDDNNDNQDDQKVNQKKKKKPTKKPVNFRRRRPVDFDEADDDDDDDLDEDFNDKIRPNRRTVILKRRRGDSYYSDQMHKRKKIDTNRIPLTDRIFLIEDEDLLDDIDFLHRNFGQKDDELDSPYYNAEDEDDLGSIQQNDGRKLGNARYGGQGRRRQQPNRRQQQNNRKEHRDTVDEINIRMKLKNPNLQQKEISEEQLDNLIRKELIMQNRLRKRKMQQKRRQQQNNANRPNNNPDKLPMNDFFQPFQDIPPLTRPIKYRPLRRKPIGILQQEERDRKRKQQQQQQQLMLLQQQHQQQQKEHQQQLLQQQKEKEEHEDQEDQDKFQVQFEFDKDQQRPLHQSQHILIPIHVVPPAIPYKEVVPQVVPQHIQVVAQHHHTVQHSNNDRFKPVRLNKRKKKPVVITYPDDENDNDDEDDDNDNDPNESEEEEEVVYNRVPMAHPTRRPNTNKNKKNKFVVNRHKPSLLKQADTPNKHQQQRARTTQKPIKDVPMKDPQHPIKEAQNTMKEVQKPKTEAQKPMKEAQKPMSENQAPIKDNDRPDASSEEMSSDEKQGSYSNAPLLPPGLDSMEDDDMQESKEGAGEGRAQYYLPQRYFQILGTDKYLAVGNSGKFLLKTGRKLENKQAEEEKSVINKTEEVAKVEEVKISEMKKEEDITEKAIEKINADRPEIESEKTKTVVKDEIKPIAEKQNNLDLTLSTTTERPIIITQASEKIVPVTIVKAEEHSTLKNIEKVLVKSEIVQEKQNGHFVVRSEPKERSFRS